MSEPMDITPQSLTAAFTQRPAEAGAMSLEELRRRLTIILGAWRDHLSATPTSKEAANCLRGAALRMAQCIDDPEVSALVQELVDTSMNVTGI